jgi:hypothetical protein
MASTYLPTPAPLLSAVTNTPADQPITRRLIDADLGHLADELPDPAPEVAGLLSDTGTGAVDRMMARRVAAALLGLTLGLIGAVITQEATSAPTLSERIGP